MPEVEQTTPVSCYGCVHLSYNGPAELKDRVKVSGAPAIQLREGDYNLGAGRYSCRKFEETICGAEEMPRPLAAGAECKERR